MEYAKPTHNRQTVVCKCKKIWEFHNDSGIVTIYHYGSHYGIPYASDPESKLGAKFSNRNKTPQQAANELIVEAIMNDNIDGIDEEKSYERE